MTYLIAGGGPGAVHAARAIRARDRRGRILMVCPEGARPYSRITVPEYLIGEVEEPDIYFVPEDFARELCVELLAGRRVAGLDPQRHTARLDDGREIRYDRLLLATGSHPLLPSWADLSLPGVHLLWDKADAERLAGKVSPGRRAVIVGGGLVGMQAARALHAHGLEVTVVELAQRLMPLQLDEAAALMLRNAASAAGVRVVLGESVEALTPGEGRVAGVTLAGGQTLPADLVIVSIGVRPNLSMLDSLDIPHERGIEVDEALRTAIPDVWAAGDVAIAPAFLSAQKANRALWLNAVRQGEAAGASMAGEITAYEGAQSMNSIQLFGLGIASMGEITAAEGMREIVLTPPLAGSYRKLVLDGDGCLRGAVLAGEIQDAGVLFHKIGAPVGQGFLRQLPPADVECMRV